MTPRPSILAGDPAQFAIESTLIASDDGRFDNASLLLWIHGRAVGDPETWTSPGAAVAWFSDFLDDANARHLAPFYRCAAADILDEVDRGAYGGGGPIPPAAAVALRRYNLSEASLSLLDARYLVVGIRYTTSERLIWRHGEGGPIFDERVPVRAVERAIRPFCDWVCVHVPGLVVTGPQRVPGR